ncbi:hypothetical protein BO70DRAFT_368732 [Aspergillus heteromorphus CBS 117.55]|uniref:Zn(2)-C6 fungal-type domain-containing protein n=1 Tax=Aspergillus heteromorphus CBS 117.55 TaxID=1448321 RepID=A0A317WV16_9EURO|nr:uncharacterized protein BO70DRAFT_368732 [Aspergillus heteromorphus CBS 117.55]PWY90196.1 hypothetical protein BO70DRAFT_368732 [Aspergillus heteromorphus CBS 117.55]
MSQRRFHKKSRHGCLLCKRNRTKCDEQRPRCGRCSRIGSACSLADQPSDWLFVPAKHTPESQEDHPGPEMSTTTQPAPSSLSDEHSSRSASDVKSITMSTAGTEQSTVDFQFTDSERERLRLMSHYALHASKSITEIILPGDRDQSMWGDWVTELAFEHDFLLHGLLSISALHLALRGVSQQKHTVMAIRHHDLGVALFRPHLSNITYENHDAVFAFSCVVALYSFGIQRSSKSMEDPLTNIHQVLTLVRGSAIALKPSHEAREQSRWSVLMLPYPFVFTGRLPVVIEDMLSKLRQRIPATPFAGSHTGIYLSAIQTLRDTLTMTIMYRRQKMTHSYFPAVCPPEFWAMVRIAEPLALAILANHAITLHWMGNSIWMEGWGKQTVDAVRQALPPDWHECIAWAVQEVESPSEADDYELEP